MKLIHKIKYLGILLIIVMTGFFSCSLWTENLVYRVGIGGGTGNVRITYTNTFGFESSTELFMDNSFQDQWYLNIQPCAGGTYRLSAESITGAHQFDCRIFKNNNQLVNAQGNNLVTVSAVVN